MFDTDKEDNLVVALRARAPFMLSFWFFFFLSFFSTCPVWPLKQTVAGLYATGAPQI